MLKLLIVLAIIGKFGANGKNLGILTLFDNFPSDSDHLKEYLNI